MEQLSYALGMVIGNNLKEMGINELHEGKFAKAVQDVLQGHTPEMPLHEAHGHVAAHLQAREAEKGKAAREAGEKFLAENAQKPGVTVLESGLQ